MVGEVLEGQRRFFMQVRFEPKSRASFDRIKDIRISDQKGRLLPISQLADIRIEEGPAQISRENIHRRLAVETNVRGRDLASFVAAAQRALENQVTLPPSYWIEWGGQFENLQRASARLAIVVPMALFLIFVLLYTTFGCARPALLIYLNVPLAASGGIAALFLRSLPFSISAVLIGNADVFDAIKARTTVGCKTHLHKEAPLSLQHFSRDSTKGRLRSKPGGCPACHWKSQSATRP